MGNVLFSWDHIKIIVIFLNMITIKFHIGYFFTKLYKYIIVKLINLYDNVEVNRMSHLVSLMSQS